MNPFKKITIITFAFSLLFIFSFSLNAEEIPESSEIQSSAEMLPEPEQGIPTEEVGIQTDGEKLEEENAESIEAAQSSTMSMMSEPGGGGAGGAISSMVIPEATIFTGTATTKIPIIVPIGRGGIAPNLALIYNSSKKNGWIGVGWDLDMGAIQRSTKFGLDYSEDDFVVLANGASTELVARTNDWGTNYYGAKIESAFTKYYKNGYDTYGWEVTTKDGTKYFYGTNADSKL